MGSHKEIYNSKLWQSLRRDQLLNEPLCCYCLQIGVITPADTVDHVDPHRGDLTKAFDPNNLQSTCKSCHDIHADAKDKGKVIAGCDDDGLPTDPNHPWSS